MRGARQYTDAAEADNPERAQAASVELTSADTASRDLGPLKLLRPYVRRHWQYAALALVSLIASSAATLAVTFAARSLADVGLASHELAAVNRRFVFLGAIAVALAVATASRFYFISRLGERVTADLRIDVVGKLITLDLAWFANLRTGELLSRISTDLTMVENMVGASVAVALRNLLMALGGLIVLMVIDVRLTGAVLLLAVATIAPLIIVGRRVRSLSARAQTRFAEALGYASEHLDALETVQAFNRQGSVTSAFRQMVEGAFAASLSRIAARAGMTALVMILVAGAVGAVLWLASVAAFVNHTMTAGALLQFVLVAVLTAGAAGSLGETWGDVQKTAGALERISHILHSRPAIVAAPDRRPLPVPARGQIDFDEVFFSYPGERRLPALDGFSLHVSPGERVALVGPSGAGKTTVFRLALRFYDPQAGRVRLDGVDLRAADPAEVRARMALVSQDPALFTGSARDNLSFGSDAADAEKLLAAAEAARAMEFLRSFPRGLDAPLGERARALSGGQRQRLAIARALVRDAPVLLLDEATSALDAESEDLVQRALAKAMAGRTTVVIAHRLATALKADRIVVMDEGRVVEEGTHADLVSRGGLYARLAALQLQP